MRNLRETDAVHYRSRIVIDYCSGAIIRLSEDLQPGQTLWRLLSRGSREGTKMPFLRFRDKQ